MEPGFWQRQSRRHANAVLAKPVIDRLTPISHGSIAPQAPRIPAPARVVHVMHSCVGIVVANGDNSGS